MSNARSRSAILAFALLLGLSFAPALVSEARAELVETEHYSVELPDTWQKLQDNVADNLTITVFATKSRDCTVTTIVGRTGGASLETIGESFARQYQAKTRLEVNKHKVGTFAYEDSNNEDGLVFVTTQDNLYMVVTMTGSLRKARAFLKDFSAKDYPDLVPKL